MRDSVTYRLLLDLSVVSESDPPEIRDLYRASAEQMDLEAVDYLTIRDLIVLGGNGGIALHLLLIALFSSLREGSVRLGLDAVSLNERLAPLGGAVSERSLSEISCAAASMPRLVYEVDGHPSPAPFTGESYRPLVLVTEGESRYLYFHKYHEAEKTLRGSLARVLGRPALPSPDTERLSSIMREVLEDNPIVAGNRPAALNDEQKMALLVPVMGNLAVISGGPGTGKTFIVLNLLRVMSRLGVPAERMRIAAPTGRAAQKLAGSIRRGVSSLARPDPRDVSLATLDGHTIHRLLGYRPSRNDFVHHRHSRIPADLVIVDEASMIDIVLLGKVFEALDDGARIVLLGDRNQLPSVEAGAVLADLIPEGLQARYGGPLRAAAEAVFPGIPGVPDDGGERGGPLRDRIVVLGTSYRSEPAIQAVARGINVQNMSVLDEMPVMPSGGDFPDRGVWRIEPARDGDDSYRDIRGVLDAWTRRYYSPDRPGGETIQSLAAAAVAEEFTGGAAGGAGIGARLFALLDEARILSPVRTGVSGTIGINLHIMNRLAPSRDPGDFYTGLPVIVTANDYARGLFNGDIGIILQSSDGGYHGVFALSDGFVSFPVEALPPIEPAYAVTVHKSQGSEYGRVLLVLSEGTTGRLLTKEVLYTGITRAREMAVLYASRETFARAIRNRIRRESGIGFGTRTGEV